MRRTEKLHIICYSPSMSKAAKICGEACVQLADGTYSADALHEQMTEGVDDRDIRATTRAWLLEKGSPQAL